MRRYYNVITTERGNDVARVSTCGCVELIKDVKSRYFKAKIAWNTFSAGYFRVYGGTEAKYTFPPPIHSDAEQLFWTILSVILVLLAIK